MITTIPVSDMKVVTRYYIDITPEQLRHIANQLEAATTAAYKGQELTLDLNDVFTVRCSAEGASASKRSATPSRVAVSLDGRLRNATDMNPTLDQ